MNLPGVVTRNLRLKAVAAVLATVTWAGVVYASNPPDTRTVSVKVPQENTAISPFVLIHPIPNLVVRVSGTREHLSAFDPAQLTVSVDYRSITQAGTQQLPVSVVNNDRDVALDSPPTSVTAEVDHLGSRTVPVRIDIKPPPQGYVVNPDATTLSPSEVSVVGPQNQLAGIQARVSADLSSIKTNFQGDLTVFLYDAAGQRVTNLGDTVAGRSNGTVQATIVVVASITSRASAVLPRFSGAPPPGHLVTGITVSPLSVVLSGPQDLLNTLDSVPTQTIPLSGLTGSRILTVAIDPPAGVTASPRQATVTITVVITITTTPPPSPPVATSSPTASVTPTPSPTP